MHFKLAKRKHGWLTSNEKCNQNGPKVIKMFVIKKSMFLFFQ